MKLLLSSLSIRTDPRICQCKMTIKSHYHQFSSYYNYNIAATGGKERVHATRVDIGVHHVQLTTLFPLFLTIIIAPFMIDAISSAISYLRAEISYYDTILYEY